MIPGNYPNFAREQTYPIPFQNSTLLPLLLIALASQKHTPDTTSYILKEYDYIIVGAGTAGSVVASRLSEIKSVSVLLLEAGPPPPLLTEVPAIAPFFIASDIDWGFVTKPQKYTARLQKNRQLPLTAGKTIGGSSSINYMIYMRGSPENYDEWEDLGATGWNWKVAFKNFIKSEDNRDPEFYKNGYHGVGGPMTVERYDTESPFVDSLIEAQRSVGYPYVDPNGPCQFGSAKYQGNMRNHQRCSVAKGYLVPAENRTNLDIVAEAFVTKVLIKDGRARGVHFDHKGVCYKITARREVILSAGAYNTPKLLMLSGIGPKKTLRKFGISLYADLPVGKNFHTHAGPVSFFTATSNMPSLQQRMQDESNILKYIRTRRGILASNGPIFGLSHLKRDPLSQTLCVPDYQIQFSEVPLQGLRKALNIRQEVYDYLLSPYENETTLMCSANLLHPRSRGRVTIASKDPYEPPVINPNYLKHPEDVRLSVAGLKECYKILDTPEMQRTGVKPFQSLIPGCEDLSINQNLYLECVARAFLFTSHHQVGTAKMGDTADPRTVVDPELRVKKIRGLRVVDASVIPIIPTGNIHTVVIMIAERASELIKKDLWLQWNANMFY